MVVLMHVQIIQDSLGGMKISVELSVIRIQHIEKTVIVSWVLDAWHHNSLILAVGFVALAIDHCDVERVSRNCTLSSFSFLCCSNNVTPITKTNIT